MSALQHHCRHRLILVQQTSNLQLLLIMKDNNLIIHEEEDYFMIITNQHLNTHHAIGKIVRINNVRVKEGVHSNRD